MSNDYIDRADVWFKAHLTELLANHEGKWAAIFEDQLLGVFDSAADAYNNGVQLAKSEKVVIKEIKKNPDKPTEISVNVTLGLMNAQPRASRLP